MTYGSEINSDRLYCEPSYMSDVLLPEVEKATESLPDKRSIKGKALESMTGIYTFSDSLQEDLCDGKVTGETVRDWAKVVGHGMAICAGVQSGIALGALGLTLTGVGAALTGIGIGAAVAIGGGYLIGKGIDGIYKYFNER